MKTSNLIVLFGTIVALFSVATAMASSQAQYSIKLDPPTGTLLPSTALTSTVALNKRYFELTDSEKKSVRNSFGDLSANQTPAFPTQGLRSIYRPLIAEQGKTARGGVLSLVVRVDETGQVESVNVIESPTRDLAQASETILKNTQFDPGFCGGDPCSSDFPLEITFQ